MRRTSFTLDERYSKENGSVFLSGIQALVRLVIEQRLIDERSGLTTGGFISGYRGSPLGGLDQELWRQRSRLEEHNIRFQPGVNEELAATAVWGTQQVGLFPGSQVDGVFGLWYGKAPGLDRAGDAIRHANMAGTAPNGGVLLVVGDDHGCKSSTLPSHSELGLKDLGIPILNPSDVQDVLDFGLFGWALSRYTGCWSGMIAVADTMDSSTTVNVTTKRDVWVCPDHDNDVHIVMSRAALDQEALLHEVKLPLAVSFASHNGINRVMGNMSRASLGIVTTGKAYLDVRQALTELGLPGETDLERVGVRLLKLGMSWPLDRQTVEEFSRGLETIIVVEEKRAFVETELKNLLYGANAPRIVGKVSPGQPGLSVTSELTAAVVAVELARYLPQVPNSTYLDRIRRQDEKTAKIDGQAKTDRLPMFCAGCPHNTSTRVPAGSRASAGIGCHYMAQWMDRDTSTFTQMGGEGINWTGQAPFTDESHIFVNLGDGTYFHSGLLAIRQAVAAGVNVTYKVLYNDAVAMTGGQPVDGALSVADIVLQLQAEGVRHVEVVSDAPEQHAHLSVPVSHRDDLDGVQQKLRTVLGCSAIIYQQTCATELRRRRKRGLVVDPDMRVLINDAVCEGCGDCSVQSNCVAVEPLETEFGIKRQINQSMCNKDFSCVKGFCPAFVLVKGGALRKVNSVEMDLDALRELIPAVRTIEASDPVNLLIAGVGGTGVVTVSALVGTAAHIDGKAVSTLDMTGLAQKGGAVFGHIRIADDPAKLLGVRVPTIKADLLLACDLISGASKDALGLLSRTSTIAVINAQVAPTAEFVLSQEIDPRNEERRLRIGEFVAQVKNVDGTRLTRRLLGDAATVNVFMLGFAYQQGVVPISLEAMEKAIELNGVSVDENLRAFHFGRLAAADETLLPVGKDIDTLEVMDPLVSDSVDTITAARAEHLTDYQNEALAERYQNLVAEVQDAESSTVVESVVLATAVAKSYAKLLAYKDEYEVARLYCDGRWEKKLAGLFEGNYQLKFLLAPPLLGTRKRRFGAWIRWGYGLLVKLKFLRGTRFDPFGYFRERREERWMIQHFETVIAELLDGLQPVNLALAERIAALPQNVKGYGHIKRRNMETWLVEEEKLLKEFHEPPTSVVFMDPKGDRRVA